jgi:hypothetical protein
MILFENNPITPQAKVKDEKPVTPTTSPVALSASKILHVKKNEQVHLSTPTSARIIISKHPLEEGMDIPFSLSFFLFFLVYLQSFL